MAKKALYLIKTARPRQWIKNLALFTALIFGGFLFNLQKLTTTFKAAAVFTLLSGSVYILNDIFDVESDRQHPFKRFRPIASGKVSIFLATATTIAGVILAFFLAFKIGLFFFVACLSYFVLQVNYTIWIKQQPILDVLAIASGFIIRVYAGAIAINSHINVWLLLCVISFALFLAIGKRRAELTLMSSEEQKKSRKVLKHYGEELLNSYTGMFANSAWLTWTLYTFMHPAIFVERKRLSQLFTVLPRTFHSEKLLMLTVPLVIYGVMRYLQLIHQKNEGESPEKVLLTDKPLISTILVWGILTVGLIYFV